MNNPYVPPTSNVSPKRDTVTAKLNYVALYLYTLLFCIVGINLILPLLGFIDSKSNFTLDALYTTIEYVGKRSPLIVVPLATLAFVYFFLFRKKLVRWHNSVNLAHSIIACTILCSASAFTVLYTTADPTVERLRGIRILEVLVLCGAPGVFIGISTYWVWRRRYKKAHHKTRIKQTQ